VNCISSVIILCTPKQCSLAYFFRDLAVGFFVIISWASVARYFLPVVFVCEDPCHVTHYRRLYAFVLCSAVKLIVGKRLYLMVFVLEWPIKLSFRILSYFTYKFDADIFNVMRAGNEPPFQLKITVFDVVRLKFSWLISFNSLSPSLLQQI